jgi:HPt (histidine-containing phosphotransfer) domain-containing protein
MSDIDPSSLDLSNLREITGDDKELEQVLFTTYLESSKSNLDKLVEICGDGNQPDWKEHSHALKGESANLGAVKLAAICQESQMAFEAPASTKKELLRRIQDEWAIVKGYLEQMLKEG